MQKINFLDLLLQTFDLFCFLLRTSTGPCCAYRLILFPRTPIIDTDAIYLDEFITKHSTRKLLLVYRLFVENNYTITSFLNTQWFISKIINLNHSDLIALKRYRRDLTSKFNKCQYKQLIYNYSLYYVTQNWPV